MSNNEQPTGSSSRFHLAAESIRLSRGGRVVLHDVSAGFERGLVTALVGPSGSGKTSFLRCLNRLDEPEFGRILLDGDDIRDLKPTILRRRVGMIAQTPIVFPGTIGQNLSYGLNQVEDSDLSDALRAADLPPEFRDRDSSALSVGEAQRVCIARALIRHPEALLLDEPTSALDRNAAAQIESLIRSLVTGGLTLVLVTHDLAQAHRVADAAVLMVEGRAVIQGDVGEVEARWPGPESQTELEAH